MTTAHEVAAHPLSLDRRVVATDVGAERHQAFRGPRPEPQGAVPGDRGHTISFVEAWARSRTYT